MPSVLINGLLLTKVASGVHYSIECLINSINLANPDLEVQVLLPSCYEGELKNCNNLNIVKVNFNIKSKLSRIINENIFIPNYISKNKIDLFHGPAYVLPVMINTRSIVTIHDLISFQFPDFCNITSSLYFKSIIPHSIRKASKIITVSKTVKKDMIQILGTSKDKIQIIYHGVEDRFFQNVPNEFLKQLREKYDLPPKFILFLGNIEPKKNILMLLIAFRIFKQKYDSDVKLVIAGEFSWKYSDVLTEIQTYPETMKQVLFLNHTDKEYLPALYQLSTMFVFPSLYEGFGMPPTEAMASSCPVIISNRGSLPEVCGENAYIIDPTKPEELADTFYLLCSSDIARKKHVQAAKKWVEKYSWETTAKQTIQLYQTMLQC